MPQIKERQGRVVFIIAFLITPFLAFIMKRREKNSEKIVYTLVD